VPLSVVLGTPARYSYAGNDIAPGPYANASAVKKEFDKKASVD